jgi:probable HAF family extracellular repeat protein
VVGRSAGRAFRTAPNSPINPATDDLGTLYGLYTEARAINSSGEVVGLSATTNGAFHAFRTAPNSAINTATDDLGTLGPPSCELCPASAYGINASGQVVGDAGRAFRTAPNSPINPATDDLCTLGGQFSAALGINALGQVVGYDKLVPPGAISGNQRAFRTAPNSPINPATDYLGTLGGPSSAAYGINDLG